MALRLFTAPNMTTAAPNITTTAPPAPSGDRSSHDVLLAVGIIIAIICVGGAIAYVIVEVKYLGPRRKRRRSSLTSTTFGSTIAGPGKKPRIKVSPNKRYAPKKKGSADEGDEPKKRWQFRWPSAPVHKRPTSKGTDSDIVNEENQMHFSKGSSEEQKSVENGSIAATVDEKQANGHGGNPNDGAANPV